MRDEEEGVACSESVLVGRGCLIGMRGVRGIEHTRILKRSCGGLGFVELAFTCICTLWRRV